MHAVTSTFLLPAPSPDRLDPTTPAAPVGRPDWAAALVSRLASRTAGWSNLVEFRAAERWTRLLAAEDLAEPEDPPPGVPAAAQIWLLSWLPGQGTPLHDHGFSSGAFAVARGVLTERVVTGSRGRAPRERTADVSTGQVRSLVSHYIHQVSNTGSEPAVSVHVYAPRLRLMNTYGIDERGLVRISTEKDGVDW